jgi:hypothetical protein
MLPDKSTQLFWPSHNNYKPTTPYCFELNTDIELDVSLWTGNANKKIHMIYHLAIVEVGAYAVFLDIGMLQIQIIKSFEADLPGIDDYILRYPICSMTPQDFDGAGSSSTLSLCDAVDFYISPTKDAN